MITVNVLGKYLSEILLPSGTWCASHLLTIIYNWISIIYYFLKLKRKPKYEEQILVKRL